MTASICLGPIVVEAMKMQSGRNFRNRMRSRFTRSLPEIPADARIGLVASTKPSGRKPDPGLPSASIGSCACSLLPMTRVRSINESLARSRATYLRTVILAASSRISAMTSVMAIHERDA